ARAKYPPAASRREKATGSPVMANEHDYVADAVAYANAAIRDKKNKRHCRLIQSAARRFLADLKRAKSAACTFEFDDWHANDACDFIEKLPHVEGRWETETIVLHPAQIFFIVQLFGFRDRASGARRFTSALYCTSRKSGKSTLAAAIMLYCMCCENEPGAQLISAATTFDQSKKVFDPAKQMVNKTKDLREAFGLEVWAKAISRIETATSFKPINAKASTQDGLNPSHTALDEIHAHKSPDLLNVLTSAAGARSNPLWLYTTTEGYTNPGPWADIRRFAFRLLDGVFGNDADHFLVVFFALDKEDKDFDESKWIKANPLIEANPHLLSAIQKEAVEAKAMPSKLAEFRIKRLNRPSATADGWIDLPKWQKCDGPVDVEMLRQHPCFAGLDLASTTDMCAFRLLWIVEDKWYTKGWRWAPDSAVAYRTERGTVPYASWASAGLLEQTPGDATDYALIEQRIMEVCKEFNIQQIAYDRWNALDLVNRLVEQGAPMIEFRQGAQSYHPAMQALERAYRQGLLHHGGDPVLNWC